MAARACLALFALLGLVLAWAAPWGLAPLHAGEPEFAELLVAALTVVALACYAVLALAAAATALSASRSRAAGLSSRIARRLAPEAWRQTVLIACGCAVAVLPATPASAGDGSPVVPNGDRRPALAGLPVPDRPVAGSGSSTLVVVRPGDSLWAITERELGPAASDSEVAARWPQWYRANRAVIGPDPDLIFPGTALQPPPNPPDPPEGEQ